MYHTSGSKQGRYSEAQYFSAPSDESSSQDSDSPHLSSVSPLSVRSRDSITGLSYQMHLNLHLEDPWSSGASDASSPAPQNTRHGVSDRITENISCPEIIYKERSEPVQLLKSPTTAEREYYHRETKKMRPSLSKESAPEGNNSPIRAWSSVVSYAMPTIRTLSNVLQEKLEVLQTGIISKKKEPKPTQDVEVDTTSDKPVFHPPLATPETKGFTKVTRNPFQDTVIIGETPNTKLWEVNAQALEAKLADPSQSSTISWTYPRPPTFNNDWEDDPVEFVSLFNKHMTQYAVGMTAEDLVNVMRSFVGPKALKDFDSLAVMN
ncbi:hypothetical protein AX774_g7896 [Zancudomyces culisetae]|uniref:Uncharacterized protein n=1 Tax=Zancudomyces culisetae TaxID=1213189 RepID=A0A1R1PCL0_ZANCU|nr:hypothetical protein AX774_g7896 [Zancudomyces culisetae]|eukprot:OMH78707.1 hypothetical protein AX774_g7896 [Zancudomyces culisetae]